MKKEEFADRLSCACALVISAEQELTEIDSHFGDADHGLTMKKIAGAIDSAVKGSDGGIKEMLDDAAMAVKMCIRDSPFMCGWDSLWGLQH